MIIVEVMGNLGGDAEERFTANKKRVIVLRVAAHVRQGSQDETVWWKVNLWNPERFEKMLPYLKKGTGLIIIGEMSRAPETYVDKHGTTQVSLSINADIVKFTPSSNKTERTQQVVSDTEEVACGVGACDETDSEDELPF